MRWRWLEASSADPAGSSGPGIRIEAPAKINLHLEVLSERPDGYHDIDSLFLAVSLADELEFWPSEGPGDLLEVLARRDGDSAGRAREPKLPGAGDNLVLKAARCVRESARGRGAPSPGLCIRLHKAIPMGAGLGGGSSDAAAALLALNRLWDLRLDAAALAGLAAQLGSDVAFFLQGGLARCTGRGEIVEPIPLDGKERAFHAVLACPDIEAPTPLVYRTLRDLRRREIGLTAPKSLNTMRFKLFWESIGRTGLTEKVLQTPLTERLRSAGEAFGNTLQEVAFRLFPELRSLYDLLLAESFYHVQLTGSGAALFGLCSSPEEASACARKLAGALKRRSPDGLAGLREVSLFVVHGLAPW
jgi:4-diphosphocytidyl-2-C-methyl-D-erythritol kinase